MIEAPLCTDCRDVFDPRHLQVTKGVGIEQIYPSVGASIKASGLWILNLLRTSYSRDLLMFILASFVSSSVGEIVTQGCDLQLMRWIHTTSFLLFPHQECVHRTVLDKCKSWSVEFPLPVDQSQEPWFFHLLFPHVAAPICFCCRVDSGIIYYWVLE